MFKSRDWLVLAALGGTTLGIATPTASAELLIEFTYFGTVWNVVGENPEHPWADVEAGDEAFFSYVIDVEQEDSAPGSVYGSYTVESARMGYDGIDVDLLDLSQLTVDLVAVGGSMEVRLTARNIWQFDDIAIFELRGFGSLSSDAIPIEFELDDFNLERGVSYGGGAGPLLQANFDSYSYRVIPGPGAWCLLLGGSLVISRRRS